MTIHPLPLGIALLFYVASAQTTMWVLYRSDRLRTEREVDRAVSLVVLVCGLLALLIYFLLAL